MCKRKTALLSHKQGGEKNQVRVLIVYLVDGHSQRAVSCRMVVNMVVTWLEMTSLLNVYIESILYS